MMITQDFLRCLALVAQKWITGEERAGWHCPNSGWVLCCLGKPFGWTSELGEARRFVPGTIAVPVTTTGGFWVAEGGDARNGAAKWEALAAHRDPGAAQPHAPTA